jgi:uncharacterized protein (TIGR00725 family)
MAPDRPVYVAIVGGYEADEATLRAAEHTGRLLAERGIVVVTGGRSGVSAAASKGAFDAGGTTIGILPGDDRSEGNPWLTFSVVTGLGDTRNALVAVNGDAVIAFDGAYGTLSEVAFALLHDKPVIGIGTWELQRAGVNDAAITRVTTPDDAVEQVAARAARRAQAPPPGR